ncbi:uncharacterized protein LOC142225140 [Haematobia irritans]|uniref:uncharacterized protein LOC142225140 n=1 Tax=Haematobia irritans TaxID=7368 RepID=UPI003F50D47D
MLEWDIGKQIGLEGKRENLKLQWLNGYSSNQRTETVKMQISGIEDGSEKYEMSKIYLVENLELPSQSFSIKNIKSNHHLAKLPLEDYYKAKPKMILSLTHAFLTVPVEVPRCPDREGPIAVRTRLGWVIYGPTGEENEDVVKRVFVAKRHDENIRMEQMMNQYFEVESILVKLDAKPVVAKSEEKALNILKSTTKYRDGRYECGLLWKSDEMKIFPDSHGSALRRLQQVENKFYRNSEFEGEYRDKKNHLIKQGYARLVSPDEENIASPNVFFLPHFAVFNPSKESLRLVFDAASKVKGVSLNDRLLPGPDLNQSLMSVLFKFREQPIAVCGDIREMFLQIAIRKEDQNFQRFLYRENRNEPVKQYVMTRAIFGATCSPTIAQYIKNFNAEKFRNEMPRAVEAIIQRHYVDDYVDCFGSEDEAMRVVHDVIKIHHNAGFTMHKIISNSDEINKQFGNPTITNVNISADKTEKILGMQWSPATDKFVFDLQFKRVTCDILENKRTPSKREALSLIMSVYDPFGFISDFTIGGKIFMQRLWKCGLEWDEKIPEALCDSWNSWLCGLKKAMATVAYWRLDVNGKCEVSFVAGKSNCAPNKFMTIPRLELQAAIMAVRLKDAIIKNHSICPHQIWFWTDSSTVIKWLTSEHRRYKQFVANRVAEILETSDEKQWRWVPGEMNPADDGTRLCLMYNPNGRWKNGPEFRRSIDFWPSSKSCPKESCSEEELRIVLSTQCTNISIFDVTRFSQYRRLKRCAAWVLRYVNNLNSIRKKLPITRGELSVDEEENAERVLIRLVQQTAYSNEYFRLSQKMPVYPTSTIKALNPYIDEFKNLRCSGRIDNAPFVSFGTKRPYILPKNDPLTSLLIKGYHDRHHHINDESVICEIRLKFWIPSIRSALKGIKAACCECKIRKCKPSQPIMGPLPEDRLRAYVRPFSYTGVDYFGPVLVAVRRSQEKRWVALFTCLTTRAVHIELSTDLSSDACLLCIRNFINRRGVPIQIRSDNGTNFVGINKELGNEQNFLDFEKIDRGLRPLGIRWKYNTPSDPSAVGSWERLVQSIKRALYATLKEKTPRPETLYSLLVECENIVNSRPLTHLPVTPEESEPITPNHFLIGGPNSTQTPAPFDPRFCSLRKQWRILQNLKNCLWNRWITEYLPELTRRTKWCLPAKPLSEGTLVLICETDQPRSKWKRGRVVKLFLGKDGVARSADVSTANGCLRRPVSKLAVLDVQECGEVNHTGSIHGGGDVGKADQCHR